MLEVLTAIQTAFNANAYLSTNFVNGLEIALGKDSEVSPTCIATILNSSSDYSTCASQNSSTGSPIRFYIEDIDVQFTIYATDGNVCAAALDQLIGTFDHVPLALATEKWLDTRRIPGLGRVTTDDERIARGDIQFSFTSQRQLGS